MGGSAAGGDDLVSEDLMQRLIDSLTSLGLFDEVELPTSTKGTTLPTDEQMRAYHERIASQSQASDDDTIYGAAS